VAALDEIGNTCSSNHAAPARERDALAHQRLSFPSASIGPPCRLFEDAEAGGGMLAHVLHIELEADTGFVRQGDMPIFDDRA
jgi:hypothetical protein